MADPLSITASLLAVITATLQTTKSLCETVRSFRDRDKNLRRLQNELEDLVKILDSLAQITSAEKSVLELLQRPIERCSQLCLDFEKSMKTFSAKSKTGFRDWAKMEFMKGDINEFIDTISDYKSTISIGLGTITMHNTKVSQKALEDYNELIQDTAYNLEVHLQRIDEKLSQLAVETPNTSDINVDLNDERAVTKQCLRVCEDAKAYIESLAKRESSLLQETAQDTTEAEMKRHFEAQQLTRQTLDENRESLAGIIGLLQQRLRSQLLNGNSSDDEKRRLQEDMNISKQCLELCSMANEVSRQKIYRIGQVTADGESDQVVVNTLADLFDIKLATSNGNSAQLVGTMTDDSLQRLTDKRYDSRWGAVPVQSNSVKTQSSSDAQRKPQDFAPEGKNGELVSGPRGRHVKPNEMRKRTTDSTSD